MNGILWHLMTDILASFCISRIVFELDRTRITGIQLWSFTTRKRLLLWHAITTME